MWVLQEKISRVVTFCHPCMKLTMFYLDEEDFDVSEVSVTFLANEDVVRPTLY